MRNIKRTLKEEARRGLWNDPGMEEMKKRAAQSPACFDVGDKALYFKEDDDEYGVEVTIVQPYAMYSVLTEDGAYIAENGKRVNYMFGYVIKHESGDRPFFGRACKLTRDDGKPAHLRLVDAPAEPQRGRRHG